MTTHADLPTTLEGHPVVAVVFGPDEDGDYIAAKPGRRYEYITGFGVSPEDAVRNLSEALDGVDEIIDEMERSA